MITEKRKRRRRGVNILWETYYLVMRRGGREGEEKGEGAAGADSDLFCAGVGKGGLEAGLDSWEK